MNYKLIFNTIAKVVKVEAILMLIPALVSAIYLENCFYAFLITAVAAFILGQTAGMLIKPNVQEFYPKDGFITVALAWVFVSLVGCIPFVISGEIPSFIDAFFETVSGFTTTGASILTNVTSLSKGLLFWRSFTQWIGGMGVLVFIMAITSKTTDRPIHILRAEMTGPTVDKLVPRSRDTAKILYLIYVALTLILVVFLLFGGMDFYESLIHAFATAGTGGFSSRAESIGEFSPYIQWVIAVFMLLFGINFNLLYLLILRKFGAALKNTELRTYVFIVLASIAIICFNIYPLYANVSDAILAATFQTSSVITTTGYATADFSSWPTLSKTVLFILMFIGGCSGSTAGGFKVSRIVILFKRIKTELTRVLHPRTVSVVKVDGEKIDDGVLTGIGSYLVIYGICFLIITLLVSINGFDFETTITSVMTCINNVGPGLSSIVGPMGSFADFSPFSKIILSIAMLLGRLEIYPLLLAFIPSTWTKK